MSEARKQFTFYESYYVSIQDLAKKDQAAIILAICAYALYEEEPKGLSRAASACFKLVRPTLDAARKKAASGKQGGSKPKAPSKQTVREIEKEKEREKEREIDRSKWEADHFGRLWDSYPAWRRGDWEEALSAYRSQVCSQEDAQRCLTVLEHWKKSDQWEKDAGQYTPSLKKWLEQGLWSTEPPPRSGPIWGASGELGEAELEAIRRVLQEGNSEAPDRMAGDPE